MQLHEEKSSPHNIEQKVLSSMKSQINPNPDPEYGMLRSSFTFMEACEHAAQSLVHVRLLLG